MQKMEKKGEEDSSTEMQTRKQWYLRSIVHIETRQEKSFS